MAAKHKHIKHTAFQPYIFAGIMLVWASMVINQSGFGFAYRTPEITQIIIVIFALLKWQKIHKQRVSGITPYSNSFAWVLVIFSFVLLPLLTAQSIEGMQYLTAFMIIYIYANTRITQRTMAVSGLAVTIGGLFILGVYSFTPILKEWNDNAISIFGIFSFFFYGISIYGQLTRRKVIEFVIISLLYIVALFSTASRGGMIFIVIAVLVLIYRDKLKHVVGKPKHTILFLSIPLVVSLVVIAIANTSLYGRINAINLFETGKSLFNGREGIWLDSYKKLINSYLIGIGHFDYNYHNSAVACLTAFGILGYIGWISLFKNYIKRCLPYIDDFVVYGAISSFYLVFIHQSIELGFISFSPTYLPYMILGIALGRTRLYREQGYKDASSYQHNNSRI